ncbi:MAG: hypothetical protein DMG81_19540 [Acidobacteria bacterium]|nr:MAG: hypothetical protein DMG81_19540 [Acidobacteriota bacterium]
MRYGVTALDARAALQYCGVPNQPSASRPGRHHIFKLEAAGILMIGALVLILILVRYGHHIAWGAR